jgi:GTPase SAR1 family protein
MGFLPSLTPGKKKTEVEEKEKTK